VSIRTFNHKQIYNLSFKIAVLAPLASCLIEFQHKERVVASASCYMFECNALFYLIFCCSNDTPELTNTHNLAKTPE